MTPARKKALQWCFEKGEFAWWPRWHDKPTIVMRDAMIRDGQLERVTTVEGVFYQLTDKGRRMLHGDSK